ncbi:CBS domain containing-hemolysin-like protein [Saccharothrix tamanrassetensis]|uniref:CBS domain containing-hemolysin-like protein n=1 Tax=Saccharothrix tamanrassetensis TaxID=1051531 RepID=A0A841CSW1_9PSEU|nr:hemolysin family protein [Saccharothrix tamanrassetensis]MBB5959238.1 CBS domain containing-hemolysin-like protein [Saccharothrix tamanrassetensis]
MSILVIFLLLAGNAFFVGAEFAIITARRDRLEGLADQGSSRARVVIRAGRELPLLIAGAQLGITLCSLGLGALGEPAVASILEGPFKVLGLPEAVLHGVAFALALVIVVALHTVLGEMVPKNLAIAGPERTALWLVPAHYWFCRLVAPLLRGFTVVATAVLRLMGVTPKEELESAYTRDELALLIAQSRQEGLLEDSEHRRLAQTLSSTERTVADVLVPLDRIRSVSARPTMGEVEDAVSATGFSRFPVADDGRLVGYLHVKDVLDLADADPSTQVPGSRIRGLPEVPVNARLDEAMAALRRAQSHLARAVAADGSVLGVVALEDLVEEYVGTVRDGTHVRREL